MKFLLAAVNAKYIHSNLGVYSLKAYADTRFHGDPQVELREYTINHRPDQVLADLYRQKPDALGFSCYIWNIGYVTELVRDLHKVLPQTEVWLGGPEVSYDAADLLRREPDVLGIMKGEGEETFAELLECYAGGGRSRETLSGLAVRRRDGGIADNGFRPAMDLGDLPFPYRGLSDLEHRIIYYESSRGCPFSCTYCLSSVDRTVRFRPLELVTEELDFFLERRVDQVKFVDRTFNCSRNHALAIWKHILEHDNGKTNFHFEISADLLGAEELELMRGMRPGLIQLEIGVQTANPRTLSAIRRAADLTGLERAVTAIHGFHNIHQHLDLIAGLPYEGYDSFCRSFNRVYAMEPEQLQLGFLKVLKGSPMASLADEYRLCYREKPPYEVLSTEWLGYEELLCLKGVEEMVEVYHNSGQFVLTLKALIEEFDSPFALFEALRDFYEEEKLFDMKHSRLARYEILDRFLLRHVPHRRRELEDAMTADLYLRENLKSRPSFAWDQSPYKAGVRAFFERQGEAYGCLRQLGRLVHVEVFSGGEAALFDYRERDPLTQNARCVRIDLPGGGKRGTGRETGFE